MKTFNENIKEAFATKEKTLSTLLKYKTNAFIESLLSEDYVKTQIRKSCLPYSLNWWLGQDDNYRLYAIHIDTAIRPFDLQFAENLKKAGFNIIYATINELKREVEFTYNNQTYTKEEIVEFLNLKEQSKTNKSYDDNRTPIANNIIEWFYKTMDYSSFIYENAIEYSFIFKYFKYTSNLDIVWANEINGEEKFFIGEPKFKSTNNEKVFLMNKGEKNYYQRIISYSNVSVVAIALICDRYEREEVLKNIINTNKTYPLFYYILEKDMLKTIENGNGNISDFDKANGKTTQNVVKFPFDLFNRIIDFNEIGQAKTNIVPIINRMLKKYNMLLNGNQTYYAKHISKFFVLYYLMVNGFDVDYNDFTNEKDISSNILTINDTKIWFKYIDSHISWNLLFSESEMIIAKELNVEYIVLYSNKEKEKGLILKEIKTGTKISYEIKDETNDMPIDILGFISFKDFIKKHHVLPKGVPGTQINFWNAIDEKEFNYKTNVKSFNEDMCFLQIRGTKRCEHKPEMIEKTHHLPFALSFFSKI